MAVPEPGGVYVWTWLPDASEPVVAGRVVEGRTARPSYDFVYGRTYLANPDAIPLYSDLPLVTEVQRPGPGLDIAGVLLDALPDSWGRRVIHEEIFGARSRASEAVAADLITYMRRSGSDRIGALDFQDSATDYVPRGDSGAATIEDALEVADRIEAGEPIPSELADALYLGSTAGGARPKAILRDGDRSYLAKFPSATDVFPSVKEETAVMDLAAAVGIEVAHTRSIQVAGRDVLLVERFDRTAGGLRKGQVSAATILGVNPERLSVAGSYPDLADNIRLSFSRPRATLRELFRRIVFNIAVRNTDDHARNTAAFWSGAEATLAPAYDLSPSHSRPDSVATHPMVLAPDGDRRSLLAVARKAATAYQLTDREAQDEIDRIIDAVREHWPDAADRARLTTTERSSLEGASILNPAIFWPAD